VCADVVHVKYETEDIDESGRYIRRFKDYHYEGRILFQRWSCCICKRININRRTVSRKKATTTTKPAKLLEMLDLETENLSGEKSNLHKINRRGHTWKWKFQPKSADHGIFQEKERCKFPKVICFLNSVFHVSVSLPPSKYVSYI
jgi:hypothetical protein